MGLESNENTQDWDREDFHNFFAKGAQSIYNLFNLLDNRWKSELLCLVSSRLFKTKHLDLNASEEPIYALGVFLSDAHKDAAIKKNFLRPFKISGRQKAFPRAEKEIVKILNNNNNNNLSKLTFVCSVYEAPKFFAEEDN